MTCNKDNQTPVNNNWKLYEKAGPIDATDTNAIAFVNLGTSPLTINGLPLQPGTGLALGAHECEFVCNKFSLSFQNTGGLTQQLYVLKGSNQISLFAVPLPSSGGVHTDVNIFDSAGNTLSSSGSKLLVLDSTVNTSINNFAAQNHSDLTVIANDITIFSTQNHTDLGAIATDITNFAAQNHSDLTAIATDITNFAAQNHSDLGAIATDITTFAAQNHSDLGVIANDIVIFSNQNHTDLTAIEAKLDTLINAAGGIDTTESDSGLAAGSALANHAAKSVILLIDANLASFSINSGPYLTPPSSLPGITIQTTNSNLISVKTVHDADAVQYIVRN